MAMKKNEKRSAGEHATVDLHNEQFCVDISFYQDTKWVEEYSEECKTEFAKKCEEKSENVCADVLETQCEVVPYTECSMSIEPVDYSETDLTPMEFTAKKCKTVKDIVKHQKMFPECRNVTKQNCETLWETDAEGNQVWAGKENCQPVTWQECKLVPRYVDLSLIHI